MTLLRTPLPGLVLLAMLNAAACSDAGVAGAPGVPDAEGSGEVDAGSEPADSSIDAPPPPPDIADDVAEATDTDEPVDTDGEEDADAAPEDAAPEDAAAPGDAGEDIAEDIAPPPRDVPLPPPAPATWEDALNAWCRARCRLEESCDGAEYDDCMTTCDGTAREAFPNGTGGCIRSLLDAAVCLVPMTCPRWSVFLSSVDRDPDPCDPSLTAARNNCR
jgi:hypothetical protein